MILPKEIRIDVYSHGLKVSKFTQRGKEALFQFCRPMTQMGLKYVGYNKFVREMIRVFAAATADRSEFRFHRNQLDDLINHLKHYGYKEEQIDLVEHPLYEPVTVGFDFNPDMSPREYQIPIIDYLVEPGSIKVVTLQTGKGKAQPLHSKIKIPGGWTTMGEISMGDDIVAPDGTTCKVNGVFPQGERDVYRVTFHDGRSTECDANHLWKVYYINTVKHRRWRVVDTLEMKRLISMPNPRVYVQLIEPEDCADKDLPLHPYLLGALLGDGCFSTNKGGLSFSTVDDFLVNKVSEHLPEGFCLKHKDRCNYTVVKKENRYGRNEVIAALREMGLMGRLSFQKFIPEQYLNASKIQRLQVLQGLMDTDGTSNKPEYGGTISYCTTSMRLAKGVQYLVRSLGGLASISRKIKWFTYSGERKQGRLAYQVNIRYPRPSELFTLPRKVERTNDENQYADILKARVLSVDYIGKMETQCISVDHPDHLYITDDFIVTHNTAISMMACAKIGVRTALIIKGMYVDKWIEDVSFLLGLKPGEVMVVRGSKDLKRLIELGKTGELDAKFIIITTKTIYQYLKFYEKFKTLESPSGYGCAPEDLFKTLGVGLRIIDEVHQEFHTNYRLDIYSHVHKTINLSATLESDDPFINRMYAIAYPKKDRFQGATYDKYISVKALFYRAEDIRNIRFIGKRKSYSHVAFEKSIMRKANLLKRYLNLINEVVMVSYIRKREPGQRMLIFCATKALCTIVTDFLKQQYPSLTVNRYISEDDYNNLLTADISVSTMKSSGTAVDVPGLRVCLATDAVSSRQANEQALGRLRRLKDWPDVTPEYLYFVCEDIPKHVTYHNRKREFFSDKVLSQKEFLLGTKL